MAAATVSSGVQAWIPAIVEKNLPSGTIDAAVTIGFFLVAALVLRSTLQILNFIWVHFLRPGRALKKYGKWAVVTGSTDGIGKAIVEEFARRGLAIVLISRTKAKLEEQAKELQEKYKIDTKIIALDFSTQDTSVFESVKDELKSLDIGILVNNVGMAYDHPEYFHLLTKEKIENLVRINIFGTTHMTHAILPGMVERKRGAIINLSSASSMVDEPLYAVYSGSKVFVNNFSVALHHEYKSYGIHVQCQIPAFVTTKLSKLRSTSFFICSPRAYAKAFVAKIGYEPLIFSYWTHALQFNGLILLLPDWLLFPVMIKRGLGIRRLAYKKKEQAQKQQ